MIGLVYKDILVMRKQFSYYLIFIGIYAVLSAVGVFPPMILSVMLVLIGMMMPMTSFGYDDQAHWEKYAVATPAGRKGTVGAKYLFAALCVIGSAALVIVLELVLSLTGLLKQDMIEQSYILLACMGVVIFINSILLPFFVKFGAEKSRTITMIIFVVIFGGSMLVGTVLEKSGPLPTPPAWLLSALPVVLGLVAVGAYVISYFIAQGIITKKEL